jgi:spermidine/putrescine transport system permease protein
MKKRSSWNEYFLSSPSIIWLFLFFVIPSIIVYAYAFKPSDLYGGVGTGWTFETVAELFSPLYLKLLLRTLWLSALTTAISLLLALPVAYQMMIVSKFMRQLLMLLIIVPFWSSLLIRIFAWKTLLHPEGVLHQSLAFLGIISEETTLLYNSTAVVFVMVYTFLPFAVLPIYSSSSKFNLQLIDAARDLGATRSQAFFKVFIPGIEQGLAAAALMVFIPAVGAYVIPDLVGGINSEMLGNKIAQKTFVERNLPQASALGGLLALAVLITVMLVKQQVGIRKKLRLYVEVRNRE